MLSKYSQSTGSSDSKDSNSGWKTAGLVSGGEHFDLMWTFFRFFPVSLLRENVNYLDFR